MELTRRAASAAVLSALVAGSLPRVAAAQPESIELPPPQRTGGKPLMEALAARRSTREYADRPLSHQVLSNLLWAAWGINRPAAGLRTAPSSHGYQDVQLYLAMADGVWIYDPHINRLRLHLAEDLRAATTTGQDFVRSVPLNLIYVSDASGMGNASTADRAFNGIADSAVIAQNVYLFCASEGLATVLRGSVPGAALARRLQLDSSQTIYFAQSVGYPRT